MKPGIRFPFVAAAAVLLLVSSALPARAEVIGSATFNGHTYLLLSPNTWTASQAEALSLGGNLVTVNSQAEQDFLYNTFGNWEGSPRYLWIGLTDAASQGNFVWINGEPVMFTFWAPGEPTNGPGEDYVYISSPADPRAMRWNDAPNSFILNAVVEIVPEPSTYALLLTGAAIGAARLWRRRRS
jgi:hypothetical protein